MTVEARWDDRLRKFKYKIPGVAGFVTPDRVRTTILSSDAMLAKEVQDLAFRVGVRLPPVWDLMVTK